VELRGNLSGTATAVMTSYAFTASDLSAGLAVFTAANMPALAISGRVAALTGGTNPTVAMSCIGVQ
jgi:hypothetical protein